MATLQEKRTKADTIFDRLYSVLLSFFQKNGFQQLSAQRLNIPRFEDVDVYFRVTGTATNANLDVAVEHNSSWYARTDTVITGIRTEGTWQSIAPLAFDDVAGGPPYSIKIEQGTHVSF